MIIGFDAKRAFGNFTGLGNYSRNLIHALSEHFPDHQYHLYTTKQKDRPEVKALSQLPNVQTHMPEGGFKPLWRSRGILKDLERDGVEVFHGLSHEIPIGIQHTGIKTVVSIHDLIFKDYPSHYAWVDRQIYDWKFRYACQHADLVIAISESTKKDIIRWYGIDEGKIEVVYQPCAINFHKRFETEQLQQSRLGLGLPTAFALYVGSLNERKNVGLILEGMALLKEEDRLPLVIVGKGKQKEALLKKAQDLGIEELVYFRENIGNDLLPQLYQLAKLFVYPSVYEGFGIPVLEALVSKTPVITSNVSSLPEAGGEAAVYIDPHSPQQMADALQKVSFDQTLREQMIRAGERHLEQFGFEQIANRLMEVYKKLC